MNYFVTITPRDPLIARDGRPFGVGQGNRMRSLNWPYPSVLAGALRTLLGKINGGNFSLEHINALKRLSVAGPLLQANQELYFPAPADLLVWEDEEEQQRRLMPLRPMFLAPGEGGCDLPEGLVPVRVTRDVKPADMPAFWSATRMHDWLQKASGLNFAAPPAPENATIGSGYLSQPEKEERTHVKIDPQAGASEEGLLFMTTGLDLSVKHSVQPLTLSARVDGAEAFTEQLAALNTFHPFGGERRLVHWSSCDSMAWNPPPTLQAALQEALQVRLVLATPAIFTHGWKPGWLDDRLEGSPPGAKVRLKLVSTCVSRWQPISGWSLEAGNIGPKALRRLVPSGSVYFFVVLEGNAATLVEQFWLQPVSDDQQDRSDGFGLALWGVWSAAQEEEGEK